MNKDDIIFKNFIILVIEIFIIINSKKLGWTVKINKNQEGCELILTKSIDKLTTLDVNTPLLLDFLTCGTIR
jgi:hypothetical protein